MAPKGTGRCKFTQLMSHHLLRNENGNVLLAIVDGDRVANHFRHNRRSPLPGFDHLFVAFYVKFLNFREKTICDKRPFFERTTHSWILVVLVNKVYFVRRRTISPLLRFFLLRVLAPRVGLPQGVTGPELPIGARPSPPPCG